MVGGLPYHLIGYDSERAQELGCKDGCSYKIHGLENIAFCDAADLAQVNGNSVKLQKLIN